MYNILIRILTNEGVFFLFFFFKIFDANFKNMKFHQLASNI